MGGGGGTQKSTSTSYTPEQSQWLAKALSVYGPQLGQNNKVYQGDRVADFTGLQDKSLGEASKLLPLFSGNQSVDTPLFKETGNSIAGLLSGETGASKITQNDADKFFKGNIYDPTMRTLKQDLLPTVDEGYAGGNFFGSAKGKARDKVSTDVASTLISQKADLDWNVLQNNQAIDEAKANRTLSAIPQAMNYGQMPAQETMNNLKIAAGQVAGFGTLFGFGEAEQTQEQMELQASMGKFFEQNEITSPQDMAVIMQLLSANYSTTTQTSQPGGKMGTVGALGGAALGALLAAPTGGLSMMAGAGIGAGFGGAGGSLFD